MSSRYISGIARRRRRLFVEQWVSEHGWVCRGWYRDPHRSTDLTADHIYPRNQYGEWGPLRVLCRSCNSKRPKRLIPDLPPGGVSYPNPL